MRAKTRPDVSDKATTAILFECFNKIDVSNLVVIFNRAPKKRYNEQKAREYFEKCAEDAGVTFPALTDDQICIVRDLSEEVDQSYEG